MRHWPLALVLALLLMLVSGGLALAQEPSLQFEQLTIEDGLSDDTVYSIAQDTTGYLWFGTQNGLNRYDGTKFTVYKNDPFNKSSLSNDNAGNIFADRDGYVWIGTWGGGLSQYNPNTDQFTNYLNNPTDPNSISFDRVQTIFQDSAGTIWVGTAGGGLNRLERESGHFTWYQYNPNLENSLSNDRVWRIAQDQQGQLWIATNEGLNRFNPQTETFTRYFHQPDDPRSVSHSLIRTVYVDSSGTVWAGTEEGLSRYNPQTDDFDVFLHDPTDPTSLNDNIINALLEDSTGRFWVGTRSGGLSMLNRDTGQFVAYVNQPQNSRSLSYNDIRWIHEDRAGVIWLGTRGGGINKLVPTSGQFIQFKSSSTGANSLNSNDIRAIFESEDGTLWIGTKSGGLNKYNPRTGKFEWFTFTDNAINPNGLSNNDIFAVYQDRQGILWLGTAGSGLDRFNPATGQFTNFTANPDDPAQLASGDINTIFEDRQNNLWIGTKGGGLSLFDRSTQTFTTFLQDPTNPASLGNNDVYAIYQDHMDRIWVGTYGGGLNMMLPKRSGFSRFLHNPEDPHTLGDNNIYDIEEDAAGNFWIATANGGLSKFDPATEKFTRYSQDDGLPTDVVYAVLLDNNGELWLSTNKGLSKFNPETGQFVNFDTVDGLEPAGYREGAAFKGRDGALYFGGINGLTKFYPAEIIRNRYVPPIVLTKFNIFNRPGIINRPIDKLSNLDLSFRDQVLSFEFAALDFTDPAKNQYAYKLIGFDDDWNYTGNRPFATYTNLDPGNYTLQIKGSNNAGVWNEEGLALNIAVTPPFWETWWFRTLALVALVGMGLAIFKLRVRSIEGQRRRLQHQVTARTRELVQVNENLRQVTSRLQNEMALAKNIQQGLLPPARPTWDGPDVICFSTEAREVGGDFYAYYTLFDSAAEQRFAVIVGDVSGKGMPAALLMAVSLGSLQSTVSLMPPKEALLAQLDATLQPYSRTTGQNVAICYAEINGEFLNVINAGGIAPLLRGSDGVTQWIDVVGLPLGVDLGRKRQYVGASIAASPGDVVIMVSDGVIEVMNPTGEMLGFDRFEQAVTNGPNTSAQAMLAHLRQQIDQFSAGAELHDDLTICVMKL